MEWVSDFTWSGRYISVELLGLALSINLTWLHLFLILTKIGSKIKTTMFILKLNRSNLVINNSLASRTRSSGRRLTPTGSHYFPKILTAPIYKRWRSKVPSTYIQSPFVWWSNIMLLTSPSMIAAHPLSTHSSQLPSNHSLLSQLLGPLPSYVTIITFRFKITTSY